MRHTVDQLYKAFELLNRDYYGGESYLSLILPLYLQGEKTLWAGSLPQRSGRTMKRLRKGMKLISQLSI